MQQRSISTEQQTLIDLRWHQTKLDNLDVDKLKTAPTGLSKLIDVVDNDVLQKDCV